MTAAADDALDAIWADFFRLRAAVAAGSTPPGEALATLRELHAVAGRTGSAHVPVLRAEVRGEIARLKAGLPPAPVASQVSRAVGPDR